MSRPLSETCENGNWIMPDLPTLSVFYYIRNLNVSPICLIANVERRAIVLRIRSPSADCRIRRRILLVDARHSMSTQSIDVQLSGVAGPRSFVEIYPLSSSDTQPHISLLLLETFEPINGTRRTLARKILIDRRLTTQSRPTSCISIGHGNILAGGENLIDCFGHVHTFSMVR